MKNPEKRHGGSVPRPKRARQLLALGATVGALGILLSLGAGSELAGAMTVAGLVLLLLGLHRFGRLGPG